LIDLFFIQALIGQNHVELSLLPSSSFSALIVIFFINQFIDKFSAEFCISIFEFGKTLA